jgi:hypothetical protein
MLEDEFDRLRLDVWLVVITFSVVDTRASTLAEELERFTLDVLLTVRLLSSDVSA